MLIFADPFLRSPQALFVPVRHTVCGGCSTYDVHCSRLCPLLSIRPFSQLAGRGLINLFSLYALRPIVLPPSLIRAAPFIPFYLAVGAYFLTAKAFFAFCLPLSVWLLFPHPALVTLFTTGVFVTLSRFVL